MIRLEKNFIKLSDVLAFIIVGLVIGLIAKGVVELMKRKGKEIPKGVNIAANIVTIVFAVAAIGFGITSAIALQHGMYGLDIRAERIFTNIQKSPIDQSADFAKVSNFQEGSNPEPVKSSYVVVYRFTCPDCEAISEELDAKLKAEGKPYWYVSSRSAVGKALCSLYGINEVPSIIAYDSQGKASTGIIYTKDGDNTILDTSVWDIAVRHANS